MGFVLECLAMRNLSCEEPSPQDPNTDSDRIVAASSFWHADFIRLQVAQEHLFDQPPVDAAYLASLDHEVHQINSLGMVASITLQEEDFSGPPLPTQSAVRFWHVMAEHYKGTPGVFFDLFNEPRLAPTQGEDWMWAIWDRGGNVSTASANGNFVGMQTLVDTIRAAGAANVIVAEGNQHDTDLSELSSHLLHGSNIAYATEPLLTARHDSPSAWDALFGRLADAVPIVMDGFRDYATGSCFRQSPTVLPELFRFLHSHGLGLVVWTLAAGNLIVGNDLQKPTTYSGASQQLCVPHTRHHTAKPVGSGLTYDPQTNVNGAGADILDFFHSYATQIPSSDLFTG